MKLRITLHSLCVLMAIALVACEDRSPVTGVTPAKTVLLDLDAEALKIPTLERLCV